MESRTSKSSGKIAAFDLDYTLLKPIGKNRFSKNRNDAQLVYPKVKTKLSQLQKDGYKIVIFTNQKGIGKHTTVEDIYYKVDTFLPNGTTIDVYISHGSDKYRKPIPGMFDQFMEDNGPLTNIFYVGDAAGRKGDFSASDAQFAHNCGIPFYTPEQYFLDIQDTHDGVPPPSATERGKASRVYPSVQLLKPPKPVALNRGIPTQTVIILVGPPGCGKSTLSQDLIKRYPGTVVVNNDTAGTAARALKLFKESLADQAVRIVVDNTNATVLNRAVYTELAKDQDYKVYAVTIDISRETANYLNYYRAYTTGKPLIPGVAYGSFYKRLEPIQKSEAYNCSMHYGPNLPSDIFEYSF